MNSRSIYPVFYIFCFALVLGACVKKELAQKTTSYRYLRNTFAALKDTLNGAEVTMINDSVKVIFPHNVIFDFDKATVRPDFIPILDRFADVLRMHDRTGILITGHTDSIGGDTHSNMDLSFRRADSARAVLQFNGVEHNRLDSWGLGAKMPVATNDTEYGRQLNRRVEFVVLYNFRKKKGE